MNSHMTNEPIISKNTTPNSMEDIYCLPTKQREKQTAKICVETDIFLYIIFGYNSLQKTYYVNINLCMCIVYVNVLVF